MIWLWLLPHFVLAAALPQPADVVLLYENEPAEAQSKYNYLFTVAGDTTIYPCAANRCSLEPFRDQAAVDLTIYKLPEGYPRVANVVDQATLAEYVAAAEHTYTIGEVFTNPTNTDPSGRTFQEVQLSADGSASLRAVTQKKNYDPTTAANSKSGWRRWLWPAAAVVISLGLLLGALWLWRLWKRKF